MQNLNNKIIAARVALDSRIWKNRYNTLFNKP